MSHIDSYKKHLVEDRRAPVNTVSSYICDVIKFVGFLDSAGENDFADINEEDILRFIAHL